jgi:DNA-binding transcriptional LysR family regulator
MVHPVDIYQLKTFVAVAREGTVTRASEVVHLSQPAVSGHIKSIEDALGLALFDRTPKGMVLTPEGQRLLAKAEVILAAHQELVDEASRAKGTLTGKLRLGSGSTSNHEAIGRLVTAFAERFPEVEVALKHGTSAEILAGLRAGSLDAGFYNEAGAPEPDLATHEVSRFAIHVVAPPGLVARGKRFDWSQLSDVAWIYPTASACCGRTAEDLFRTHHLHPKRVISIDRVEVTRTLVASGVGVGLLHDDVAREAERRGEVEIVVESPATVRVLFALLERRAKDPLLEAATSIIRQQARGPRASAG